MKIVKYLSETDTRGIIYYPDETEGIEFYVDADLAVGWERAENTLSWSGHAIFYAGCPVLWSSKL